MHKGKKPRNEPLVLINKGIFIFLFFIFLWSLVFYPLRILEFSKMRKIQLNSLFFFFFKWRNDSSITFNLPYNNGRLPIVHHDGFRWTNLPLDSEKEWREKDKIVWYVNDRKRRCFWIFVVDGSLYSFK